MAAFASASTAASDPNSNSSSFDVFINHHGGDVKKTFASHLYLSLRSSGLKVFLDQPESQRGDYFISQIKGAIQAASVHVAIFSVRYAESTWCLNEVLWMSESKAPIIPVFYHVKPAELRWTRGDKDGVYAQALRKLEQKTTDDPQTPGENSPLGSTRITNWRNALSIQYWRNALSIAWRNALSIQYWRNALSIEYWRNAPPKKTLRHNPATVEQWRNTLRKVSLISGFELSECNGDEGILLKNVIESVLRYVKKPLDVAKYPTGLDEKIAEFENKVLLPHLHSGRKPQIVGIVGLGGVGKTTLSKELFNRKSSQYSRCCFLDDVRENVNKGSLPSLQNSLLKKLTGTDLQLSSKDEAIAMLKKHLPSQEILLILDDVDKVDQVDALLPNQTSIHSNSLILITSRDRDVLTRSGVEKSSIYELSGLSKQQSLELFCWHAFRRSYPLSEFEDLSEKFVNACNGLPLSLKVLGALLYGNTETSFWHQQLNKLVKLLPTEIQERLRINYETLDSHEKQMFLDIACFFLGESRDTAIRIWNGSDWAGELGFQTLQNKCLVEVVEANRSTEIRMHDHLRDMGRAEALVSQPLRFWRMDDLLQQSSVITVRGIRMVLSDCQDEEFDGINMRRLQLVDTEGILLERILKRVKSPDLIWLYWKKCPYPSLPSWIPMKKLRVLRVSGSKLQTLWQLESQAPECLEELWIDGCQQLKSIQGLTQLTKLHRLDVSRCTALEELPNMETLVCLEELWAEGCVKLKRMRGLEHATKLQQLKVDGCTQLEELPLMEKLVSLEELSAWRCVNLKSIQGLENTTKLKQLNVDGCTELEELPNMETLASLEVLRAKECVKLKRIRGLEHATKLKWLLVGGCTQLEELPNMKTLVSLEWLLARGCVKVKTIRGLEHATKLKVLSVDACTELEEMPNMESLESLEELRAQVCVKLKSIRGLEHATKLRVLDVDGCTDLEELPSIEALVSLQTLSAEECMKLKSIWGLEHATKLERLDVGGCTELQELPNMETLVCLEEFWAWGCVKVKSIRGLEHATKLKELSVSGCTELKELPNMETLVALEVLRAKECVKLKSIQGLEHATKLQVLDVEGCIDLEELPNMETLVSLEYLWAEGCVKLKRIRGLEHLTKLKRLRLPVGGCTELQELPLEVCMQPKTIHALEGVRAGDTA